MRDSNSLLLYYKPSLLDPRPYLLRRLGDRATREIILSGEPMGPEKALALGLIHEVVPAGRLEEAGKALSSTLLKGGPRALASCKEMLRRLPEMNLDEAGEYTVSLITQLRESPEGQEGMKAFLEKRKPDWDGEAGERK